MLDDEKGHLHVTLGLFIFMPTNLFLCDVMSVPNYIDDKP